MAESVLPSGWAGDGEERGRVGEDNQGRYPGMWLSACQFFLSRVCMMSLQDTMVCLVLLFIFTGSL